MDVTTSKGEFISQLRCLTEEGVRYIESVHEDGTLRVRLWDLVTDGGLSVREIEKRRPNYQKLCRENRVSDTLIFPSRFSAINCSLAVFRSLPSFHTHFSSKLMNRLRCFYVLEKCGSYMGTAYSIKGFWSGIRHPRWHAVNRAVPTAGAESPQVS